MDIDEVLHDTLEWLLSSLDMEFDKISINEEENNDYHVNVSSKNPSHLIGYHGENIYALQHMLKTLAWKKTPNERYNISLDVDDYRKRQEENVINLAKRKIEAVRKYGKKVHLPAMSPYFRRKIHLMCMEPGFEDLETLSEGQGDRRHVVLKLK